VAGKISFVLCTRGIGYIHTALEYKKFAEDVSDVNMLGVTREGWQKASFL
jgi:hypothetical protein